jgi:hypothetical protein
MPLKVSSNNRGTWITWTTPDESVSSTFRINPEAPDEKILEVLFKATRFIAAQMGSLAVEIAELELEIMGTTPGPSAHATAMDAVKRPAPATAAPAVADPNAERILMTPAKSDLPAGGVPITTFGWSSMPTTSVPAELAAPDAGGWEMIPPGEM